MQQSNTFVYYLALTITLECTYRWRSPAVKWLMWVTKLARDSTKLKPVCVTLFYPSILSYAGRQSLGDGKSVTSGGKQRLGSFELNILFLAFSDWCDTKLPICPGVITPLTPPVWKTAVTTTSPSPQNHTPWRLLKTLWCWEILGRNISRW